MGHEIINKTLLGPTKAHQGKMRTPGGGLKTLPPHFTAGDAAAAAAAVGPSDGNLQKTNREVAQRLLPRLDLGAGSVSAGNVSDFRGEGAGGGGDGGYSSAEDAQHGEGSGGRANGQNEQDDDQDNDDGVAVLELAVNQAQKELDIAQRELNSNDRLVRYYEKQVRELETEVKATRPPSPPPPGATEPPTPAPWAQVNIFGLIRDGRDDMEGPFTALRLKKMFGK